MAKACVSVISLMLAVLWLGACSSAPPAHYGVQPQRILYQGAPQTRLARHYEVWAGTPHQMGGLSRRGIDCSGFVYVTYRDVFGMHLPRSTDQLSDIGEAVSLDQLRGGDLLIFKTGFKQRHVGIYVGQGQFIHASSSRGVMSSRIDSEYWSDAYQESRRVLE